jgi:hypothetical protein
MSINRKKFSYFLIVLIVCVLFYIPKGTKLNALTSPHQKIGPIRAAESIGSISIDGNNELASHPNVTGLGTWNQPYIIENYEIGGPGNIGINITNTNQPLIINYCIIENFNYGIWLQNSSNVKIYNSTIDNIDGIAGGTGGLGRNGDMGVGIYLTSSSNISLTGNTIANITGGIGERYIEGGNGGIGAGIYVIESLNISLTDNTIIEINGGIGGEGFLWNNVDGRGGNGNLGVGIYIKESNYNTLNNNSIMNVFGGNGGEVNYYYGGDGGIGAGFYFLDSSYNNLTFNKINIIRGGNGGYSMYGGDGAKCMGIHLTGFSNNNLINNSIEKVFGGSGGGSFLDPNVYPYISGVGSSDYGFGIYLSSSYNNSISANIIREIIGGRRSSGYGMRIYSGTKNIMHLNSFIDNSINAYGGDLSNKWDNGSIGNYWDDYQGIDINDDGIGDTPYEIRPGWRFDNFPLWDDGDDLPPELIINNPLPNQIFGNTSPEFNLTINDSSPINGMWYTLDEGLNNFTFSSLIDNINQSAWSEEESGLITIRFYAKDEFYNTGFQEITVIKDLVSPNITINEPSVNQIFGNTSPEFNLTTNDSSPINDMWYTLDGGLNNFTFPNEIGKINQSAWSEEESGLITIRFYIKDEFNNTGFQELTVIKDLLPPNVIINEPSVNQLFGSEAPMFNLTLFDYSLNTSWYTIDDGITNYTFTGFTGFINQIAWELQGNGTLLIRFYAKDSIGNLAYLDRIIRKDVLAPIITINAPTPKQVFGKEAPSYALSIIEGNLDRMWYTLDNGINNITISELTGIIYQDLWENLPNGNITVKFYVNDTLGNISFEMVTIVKDAPPPETISGYDLFIILSAFSITIIIIRRKWKYHRS